MPQLATLIESYGLAFVFINVLAESAGMPLPAYPALIVAAALASSGDYSPAQILASPCLPPSSQTVAGIGRLALWQKSIEHVMPAIAVARTRACGKQSRSSQSGVSCPSPSPSSFLGLLSLATALAGTSRIRIASFLAFDAIGILAWSTVPVVVGIVFRDAISDVLDVLEAFGRWVWRSLSQHYSYIYARSGGRDIASFDSCEWIASASKSCKLYFATIHC